MMTTHTMEITADAHEKYLNEEARETAIQNEEDEWNEGDFDDEPILTPIDGLIVDTRDWMYPNVPEMEFLNISHRVWTTACETPFSEATTLRINRRISATNWRRWA